MTDEQAAKVLETLGRLDERSERLLNIVEGNGQPGLKQRVEELEASKNRTIGAVSVLGVIGTGVWGLLEWAFHIKK